MDIEVIKKLIRKYQEGHSDFMAKAEVARRYYENETDILFPPSKEEREKKEKPLRNADNRIPFNFHGMLVDQKAAYMFTALQSLTSEKRGEQKAFKVSRGQICEDLLRTCASRHPIVRLAGCMCGRTEKVYGSMRWFRLSRLSRSGLRA